jgi:hypothetical protein
LGANLTKYIATGKKKHVAPGDLQQKNFHLIAITVVLLPPSIHSISRVGATILRLYNRCIADAEVAELADAPALGAGGRKAVGVRVPSSAFFNEPAVKFYGLDSIATSVYV